ncbi:hypothetical protein JCM8547_007852 [Rhodosporidiobolus lusitaniae]
MASPPPSSYVPVSLSDTLNGPSRTYRSAKTAPSSSSSNLPARPGPRPSHAASGSYSAKERATRDAQASAKEMMRALGLGGAGQEDVEATPQPQRTLSSRPAETSARPAASSVEVASLRAALGDKDDELTSLRSKLALVEREKKDLLLRCERLEKELAGAVKAGGAGGAGGGKGALDAKQMEELERQFEAQERLLAGFQREAEKSMQELDGLRNRQRRFTDFLERTYGSSWEEDLGLSDRPNANSSPIARSRLAARASLGGTSNHTPPALNQLNTDSSASSSIFDSSLQASPAIPEEGDSRDQSLLSSVISSGLSPALLPSSASSNPALSAALKQHLESVQALIRSMETRLIARDVELAEVEKRAREEKEEAKGRARVLEEVVRRMEERMGEVQVAA